MKLPITINGQIITEDNYIQAANFRFPLAETCEAHIWLRKTTDAEDPYVWYAELNGTDDKGEFLTGELFPGYGVVRTNFGPFDSYDQAFSALTELYFSFKKNGEHPRVNRWPSR